MACNNCNNCLETCNCIELSSSDSSILVAKNGCILDFKVNPAGGSGNLTSLTYNSGTRVLTYTNNLGNSNNITLSNDIQALGLSGNIITLSKGGGSVDLTSLLTIPTFAATSTSLVITAGGTHGFTPTIELVPSTDLGNSIILGTDHHPYARKVTMATGGCLSFTTTIVGGITTFTPIIDYTCLGSNLINGGWNTIGNAGTNPTSNFLGTTDNNDLVFRRNNIKAGQLGTQNTSFGVQALLNNISGTNNTAIGANSLLNNIGNSNTAFGWSTLQNNVAGTYNTAVGLGALLANIGGSQNVSVGQSSLVNNTGGSFNVAIGTATQGTNISGNSNITIGNNADVATGTTSNAIALGTNSIAISGQFSLSNTITSLNFPGLTTGVGYILTDIAGNGLLSLRPASGWSTLGNSGTNAFTNFLGTTDDIDLVFKRNNIKSGLLNTSLHATAFGVNALGAANTGDLNTAFGNVALLSNTSGNNNTAIGASVLQFNILGINNTGVGTNALKNTTGSYNTAIGQSALINNAGGSGNTAVGYTALNSIGSGTNNTAIGNAATTISSNTANGIALGANAIADNNQLAISPQITTISTPGLSTGVNYILTDLLGDGNLSLQSPPQNKIDEFIATTSQTSFTLTQSPIGDVPMYKNGLLTQKALHSVSGNTITYTGVALIAGDIIDFIYIY